MPKRDITLYIVDILIAREKIRIYTKDFISGDELLSSDLHWDATLREFQIIGDATRILIDNCFISEEYRVIVDFRNMITHAYFGIDEQMIWDIITRELPDFIADIHNTITQKRIDLSLAITYAIDENEGRSQNVVNYLNSIKNI